MGGEPRLEKDIGHKKHKSHKNFRAAKVCAHTRLAVAQ